MSTKESLAKFFTQEACQDFKKR